MAANISSRRSLAIAARTMNSALASGNPLAVLQSFAKVSKETPLDASAPVWVPFLTACGQLGEAEIAKAALSSITGAGARPSPSLVASAATALVRGGELRSACALIASAARTGVPPSQPMYAVLLGRSSLEGRRAHVRGLYAALLSKAPPPLPSDSLVVTRGVEKLPPLHSLRPPPKFTTPPLLGTLFRVIGQEKDALAARRLWALAKRRRWTLWSSTYASAVRAAAQCGQPGWAASLVNSMMAQVPSWLASRAAAESVNKFRRKRANTPSHPSDAPPPPVSRWSNRETRSVIGKNILSAVTTAIGAAARIGSPALAEDLMRQLNELRRSLNSPPDATSALAGALRPTQVTYNAWMSVWAGAKDVEAEQRLVEILKIWQLAEDDGALPDHKSYQILIQAHLATGNRLEATAVLRSMSSHGGLLPTISVFNTLLTGAAEARDVEWALDVVEDALGHGLEPDNDSYALMLRSCDSTPMDKRLWDIVESYLEHPPRTRSPLEGFKVYGTAARVLARAGAVQAAVDLMSQGASSLGREPPASAWIGVARGAAASGRPAGVSMVLAAVDASPDTSASPHLMEALVEAQAAAGHLDEAEALAIDAESRGFTRTPAMSLALLRGAARASRPDVSLGVFQAIPKTERDPALIAATMAGLVASEPEKALEVWAGALNQGAGSEEGLAHAIRAAGELERAKDLWKQGMDAGIPSGLAVRTAMAGVAAAGGDASLALSLIDDHHSSVDAAILALNADHDGEDEVEGN